MLGQIDERKQLVSSSQPKCSPPEEKERNIGANPRRNAMANRNTQLIRPESRQRAEHCGGITTAATQTRFEGNPFVDHDREIAWRTVAHYAEGPDGGLPH
tara:strand:- start:519 stop:818 length:300 start_codon:yes stop_codon:yes gene_type:complete